MTISGMEGVTLDSVKFEVEKDMYDINLSEICLEPFPKIVIRGFGVRMKGK